MFSNELAENYVKSLEGKIIPGWTKAQTKESQSYYVNHEHHISQWDHPEYIKLMSDISAMNSVKYAAYRAAFKLRYLQTKLKCHEISFHSMSSAFDKTGLRSEKNNKYVTTKEMEKLIFRCYKSSCKHKFGDPYLFSELLINMLINTLDQNRSGKIQILKAKIFLTVMCGGRLQEKFRYIFNEIADLNQNFTRKRLANLLFVLSAMTELVSEHLSFGSSLVPAAVESCFKNIPENKSIKENIFHEWLLREPQTLVWWTTLYRISISELVCHDVKCSSCKTRPIIGMRYQCLKCLAYNLCQDCFLHGQTSRNHKLTHPLQEYCNEATGEELRKSFLKILINRFKDQATKPRYLIISSSDQSLSGLLEDSNDSNVNEAVDYNNVLELKKKENRVLLENNLGLKTICLSSEDCVDVGETRRHLNSFVGKCHSDESIENSSSLITKMSPWQEIFSIMKRLEEGEIKLATQLSTKGAHKPLPKDLIEMHREDLQTQINKLKNILMVYSQYSKTVNSTMATTKRPLLPRMESTPICRDRGLHLNLSPIGTPGTVLFDNQQNHFNEEQRNPSFCLVEKSPRSSLEGTSLYTSHLYSQESEETITSLKKGRNVPVLCRINDCSSEEYSSWCSKTESSSKYLTENEYSLSREIASTSEDFSSKKSLESTSKKFVDVEEELQDILLYLDEALEALSEEDIQPNVVASVNEIFDSLSNFEVCSKV